MCSFFIQSLGFFPVCFFFFLTDFNIFLMRHQEHSNNTQHNTHSHLTTHNSPTQSPVQLPQATTICNQLCIPNRLNMACYQSSFIDMTDMTFIKHNAANKSAFEDRHKSELQNKIKKCLCHKLVIFIYI